MSVKTQANRRYGSGNWRYIPTGPAEPPRWTGLSFFRRSVLDALWLVSRPDNSGIIDGRPGNEVEDAVRALEIRHASERASVTKTVLQPAHESCNKRRRTKDPEVFRASLKGAS